MLNVCSLENCRLPHGAQKGGGVGPVAKHFSRLDELDEMKNWVEVPACGCISPLLRTNFEWRAFHYLIAPIFQTYRLQFVGRYCPPFPRLNLLKILHLALRLCGPHKSWSIYCHPMFLCLQNKYLTSYTTISSSLFKKTCHWPSDNVWKTRVAAPLDLMHQVPCIRHLPINHVFLQWLLWRMERPS